jgi:methyltransferase
MARLGRGDRLYLLLLAVVGAQRLLELLLSRRNERRAGAAIGTAGERSYPLMVTLHVALFALPLAERRLLRRRARPALALAALTAEVAATGLRLWAIRALGRHWNVRGRVHKNVEVISSGPYRYVRHPNYSAVALEMAALPLAGGATRSAALLSLGNALVLLPRVRGEETLLAATPGYRALMAGKPRFLPRWRAIAAIRPMRQDGGRDASAAAQTRAPFQ